MPVAGVDVRLAVLGLSDNEDERKATKVSGRETAIYLGLDVGKTDHWACAVTQNREIIWNKALPNDERKLVDLYTALSKAGDVLVVVD